MGWPEVITELEEKLRGAFKGTFRPQDDVPLFWLIYPPEQEREALRRLRQMAERMGNQLEVISMAELLREALRRLHGVDGLRDRLRSWEAEDSVESLALSLEGELLEVLRLRLPRDPSRGIIILRTGSLCPFVDPFFLFSRLETEVRCKVVIAYPSQRGELGAFLDWPLPRPPFHRGEAIRWR